MATTQQAVMDGLYTLMTANVALNAAVGGSTSFAGRIYDTLAPENSLAPFVTFQPITDPVQGYFASNDIQAEWQVDIWGDRNADPKLTRAVADLAYAALDRTKPTLTGYLGAQVICLDRGNITMEMIEGKVTQKDLFHIMQTYRVFATGNT